MGVLIDRGLHRKARLERLVYPYRPQLVNSNSINLTLADTIMRRHPGADSVIGEDDSANWYPCSKEDGWIPGTDRRSDRYFVMRPNEFILAATVERVEIPKDCCAMVDGRSTVGRGGVMIECAGWCESDFGGNITLEMKNLLPDACAYVPWGHEICQIIILRNEPHYADEQWTNVPERLYSEIGRYQDQTGPTPARAPRT